MLGIKVNDGNLEFGTVSGIEEFEQRIVNALQVFSVETYWDTTKGISFDVITSKDENYKLQHIKKKLLEWYSSEITGVKYEKISKENDILTAVLIYQHKKYGEQEVNIIV